MQLDLELAFHLQQLYQKSFHNQNFFCNENTFHHITITYQHADSNYTLTDRYYALKAVTMHLFTVTKYLRIATMHSHLQCTNRQLLHIN